MDRVFRENGRLRRLPSRLRHRWYLKFHYSRPVNFAGMDVLKRHVQSRDQRNVVHVKRTYPSLHHSDLHKKA